MWKDVNTGTVADLSEITKYTKGETINIVVVVSKKFTVLN